MWNLKNDTNDPIYETEIDSVIQNRVMVAKGEVGLGQGWSGADVSYYI